MRTLTTLLALAIYVAPFGAAEPRVTSVSPSPLVMSPKAQVLKVTGTGFAPGLTVEIMLQGNTETYSGAAIQGQAATSFEISVVLAQPGAATLVVRNTDGGLSPAFPLTVTVGTPPEPTPRPGPTPVIDRATPETATRGTVPQIVTLTGSNFGPAVTVTVTSPTGVVTVIQGNSLESATATTIKFRVVLDVAGDWTVAATNPPGQSSNTVTIVVT